MPARPAITIRVRVIGSNWTSPTTWLVPPRRGRYLGLAPDLPGRTTDRQPHATGVGRQWRPGGPAVHRTPDGRAVRADARRVGIESEEHRLHPSDNGRGLDAGGVGPTVHPRQAAQPDAGQDRGGHCEVGRPHAGGAGGDVEPAADDGQLFRHRRPAQQLPGRRGFVGVACSVDAAARWRSHRGVEHVRIERIGCEAPHRLTGQAGRCPRHTAVRRAPHTVEDGPEPEPVPDRPIGDEQPADRAWVGVGHARAGKHAAGAERRGAHRRPRHAGVRGPQDGPRRTRRPGVA